MFENLSLAPPDSILGLMDAFAKDQHPGKINLGVGVFKDEQGNTPVLPSVKVAETKLLASEKSKGYLSIDGLKEYCRRVAELLLGPGHEILTSGRSVTLQTPGGTGALRVAADFLHLAHPRTTVWMSKPTWPNHPSIFQAAGLAVESYPYFDPATNALDLPAMLAKLRTLPAGDVVLLHGCCHNPTGIDPTVAQWKEIAAVVAERKLMPLVDFAYQGFGTGLTEDAAGLMELLKTNREAIIATSYSKNFGLYNERVGALTVVAADKNAAEIALSNVKLCVRANYSNPPCHGGATVAAILADPPLRAQWEQELAAMRTRINGMRKLFVRTMKEVGITKDFSFIERQLGMFSFSGLNSMQVDELKKQFGIYIVGNGRINVAGMSEQNIRPLCEAIKAVLS